MIRTIKKLINTFVKTYVNVVTECATLDAVWKERNAMMLEAQKESEMADYYRTRWHNFDTENEPDEIEERRLQHTGFTCYTNANRIVDDADAMWNAAVRQECGEIRHTWDYVYDTNLELKWKVYTLKKRGVKLNFVGIEEKDWFIGLVRNSRR
jgi:hypothetical protein